MLAQNFSLGDTSQLVIKLQEFLRKFGYLDGSSIGVFDKNTVDALQLYQQFNRLPVTGVLDIATAEHMNIPRCGVTDNPLNLPKFNFVATGVSWPRNNLTYTRSSSF